MEKLVTGYIRRATPDGREVVDNGEGNTQISSQHRWVHEQYSWVSIQSQVLGSAGTMEVRVGIPATASKEAHLLVTFESALSADYEIWANTTKTDASGNRMTSMNRVLLSSNTPELLVCHTPGGSQAGNADLKRVVGAPGTFFSSGIGGSGVERNEIVVSPGTQLLIKITSNAASNSCAIVLDWYEKPQTIT